MVVTVTSRSADRPRRYDLAVAIAKSGETVELLQQLIRNECVNDGTPDSGE
jgi:hypothetical protein